MRNENEFKIGKGVRPVDELKIGKEGFITYKYENPFVGNHSKIQDRRYYGANPFISVDPVTGARKEVATAQEDIANRRAFSRRSGIPVEQVSAPAPIRGAREI